MPRRVVLSPRLWTARTPLERQPEQRPPLIQPSGLPLRRDLEFFSFSSIFSHLSYFFSRLPKLIPRCYFLLNFYISVLLPQSGPEKGAANLAAALIGMLPNFLLLAFRRPCPAPPVPPPLPPPSSAGFPFYSLSLLGLLEFLSVSHPNSSYSVEVLCGCLFVCQI